MYQVLDKAVVEQLKGKKIREVVAGTSTLRLKFEDGSELVIEEDQRPGADGGWYWSTKFTLEFPGMAMRPQTLFQT